MIVTFELSFGIIFTSSHKKKKKKNKADFFLNMRDILSKKVWLFRERAPLLSKTEVWHGRDGHLGNEDGENGEFPGP